MTIIITRWTIVLLACWMTTAVTTALSDTIKQTTKPTKVTLHSFDWSGKIPEKLEVVVNNPYGDIRSRNHGENKIILHAAYQKIGDTPLEPEFVINKKNGKWHIDVVYKESILDKKGNLRGRTDLAILFPDTIKINASTDSGMIKIDRSSSDVVAKSRSGEIKLKTTGLFSVQSESGDINLALRGFKKMGESLVISKSGNIVATFFSDMNITISAKTNGKITKNGAPISAKQDTHTHGKEINTLSLITQKGDIDFSSITPPDLVKSVTPVASVTHDLRDLPTEKPWQPGDPIIERHDKINHNLSDKNKDHKSQ